MKKAVHSLLFLLITITLFSQQKKIDSLENVLKTAKEDTNKVNTLNALSMQLWRTGDFNKSKQYATNALSLCEKLNFKKGLATAYNNIGISYRNLSDYTEALKNHLQALTIMKELGDKKGLATTYNGIGLIYKNQGNYPEALNNFLQSLKIDEVFGDKQGMASSYNNIGIVYWKQGNSTEALKNHLEALTLREEINDKKGLAASYNNIGSIYEYQGDSLGTRHDSLDMKNKYSEALKNHLKALKIKIEIGDKRGIGNSYNNIGTIYNKQGNRKEALKNHLGALKIREEIGDKEGVATSYINLGTIFTEDKKYKEAKNYFINALQLSIEIKNKDDIQDSYKELSQLSALSGDFKNAYQYHKLYSDVKDSLLNEESSKQIVEMQTKYETEKKEQQITLLNKDKELQDAQLNRQKIIIWSVAAGLLVVLTLSIFIFRERRKSEKLLLNILPVETARELKANGKATAKHYESVTVMFTDFKGFTTIAEKLSAEELVSELDFLFKKFDEIISKYNIEKIKTIGDAYMCASGLPTPNSNHAENIVRAALEIQKFMEESAISNRQSANEKQKLRTADWNLRIGIHSGPVTAGVVGDKKFAYDIWGDTVNTASRMESSGEAGRINISGATYQILQGFENLEGLEFKFRGKIPAKNKGEIDMYFVKQSAMEKII
ncbi:MAG: tetratricopeptide repeat protein [Bacteroidetes bacterium]|nr:tetratricopeptide repeat protein [Bacteroidota bacterium]